MAKLVRFSFQRPAGVEVNAAFRVEARFIAPISP